MSDLEAIRARNNRRKAIDAVIDNGNEAEFDAAHSECEADVDALLAEVEKRQIDELRRRLEDVETHMPAPPC